VTYDRHDMSQTGRLRRPAHQCEPPNTSASISRDPQADLVVGWGEKALRGAVLLGDSLPGIQRDQCSAQAQRGNRGGKGGCLVEEGGVDHVAVDGMAPGAVAVAHSTSDYLRVAVAEDLDRRRNSTRARRELRTPQSLPLPAPRQLGQCPGLVALPGHDRETANGDRLTNDIVIRLFGSRTVGGEQTSL
jgi:hypothetical protein